MFEESGKEALMTVYRNEGLFDTSNVEFAGGRLIGYDKANRTPRMQHIDYGLGVFRSAADRLACGRGLCGGAGLSALRDHQPRSRPASK